MKFSPLVVVAVALFSTACGATIDSARFVKAAPVPDDRPIKYYSTKVPACEYEELGIVRGYPKTGFTKLQQVLDEMGKEARRMGGDAIIGISQVRTGGETVTEGGVVKVEDANALVGTVVRC